jgi:UDP-2,3-diacylglucosamine pyrophosphatase LpxH
MKLFVISDLHLGGRPHAEAGAVNPAPGGQICHAYPQLTRFIDSIAQQGTPQAPVELIINGDIVDFLMEDDYPEESCALPWLPDEARIIAKFKLIIERTRAGAVQAGYGPFEAMAQLLARGQDLTFILGNHDVELSLPKVRHFLEQQVLGLGRASGMGRFRFLYDGEAYVRGDLLIEHGNRYDPWNMIDHSALRQERSMLSRGLGAQMLSRSEGQFLPPPGSLMVTNVINHLKRQYRFVDLLKPEDKAAIPILLALHPKLEFILKALLQAQRQRANAMENPVQPKRSGNLSSRGGVAEFDLATSLEMAMGPQAVAQFGIAGAAGGAGGAPLSAGQCWDKIKTLSGNIGQWLGDSASLFDQSVAKQVRYPLLRRALSNWRGEMALRQDSEAPEYLEAVRELAQVGGFRCILFGHTHLPKQIDLDHVRYLNTGTWADIMQIPPAVLADVALEGGPFEQFLRDLQANRVEPYLAKQLSYAELVLQDGPDGETVRSAVLREFV